MPIKRVSASKSLGVMIHENLTWHFQVDLITKKVNKSFYVLRRLREFAELKTLVAAYKSLVQPHFDYCSQIWGCLGITLQNKLQRLQNRAVRIITKCGYDYRSIDILNDLELPNLSVRRNDQLCTIMYQLNNGMVPDYLIDLFTKTNVVMVMELDRPNSILCLQSQKQILVKNPFHTEAQRSEFITLSRPGVKVE